MELNEMEKRLLFQVEGDYQYKVLNELHMGNWISTTLPTKQTLRAGRQSNRPLRTTTGITV
ncbi:hypothetical protein [Acutalibacter sp. JLR.KK004]|uniref:hypothetical protein n=1 Tax=Acutalibacter sp. JLR.KK004 TaxID=3112622 RepID=UPI002FF38034